MASYSKNISNPVANLKLDNALHRMSLSETVMNVEHYAPLRIIDKHGKCTVIPSSFKFFNPFLANICGSLSSPNDIYIIAPDCSGSVIVGLCELVSTGTFDIGMEDYKSLEMGKEIDQKPSWIEEIIETGSAFNVKICREKIVYDLKTEELVLSTSVEYSELPLKSDPGVKIENVLQTDFNPTSVENVLGDENYDRYEIQQDFTVNDNSILDNSSSLSEDRNTINVIRSQVLKNENNSPHKSRNLSNGVSKVTGKVYENSTLRNSVADASKFRTPYSESEEEAVVNFFLSNGGFSLRKGNRIWIRMQNDCICPGRTWQSMKQRWKRYISRNLDKYNVCIEDLERKKMDREIIVSDNSSRITTRGFRSNANYYTEADDRKILNFIIENKRYKDVGGRSMWLEMEKSKLLPDRTFHSLKERYRKIIIRNIQSYGLAKEYIDKFVPSRRRYHTS